MDALFFKLILLIIFILIIVVNNDLRKQFIEQMKTNMIIKYMVFPILLYVIFVIALLSINVKIEPPQLVTVGLFVVMILGVILGCIEDRKKKKQEKNE
ncbi:MAG: hypothetical protein KO253_08070 [Methanobrevibacter arboriphilus]|nr:hypothetical protein [Methanobrevibacter arboriphilus]